MRLRPSHSSVSSVIASNPSITLACDWRILLHAWPHSSFPITRFQNSETVSHRDLVRPGIQFLKGVIGFVKCVRKTNVQERDVNVCMHMTVYPSIEKMSTKRICSGECRAYRERAELLHSRQRGQLVGGDVQLLGHPGGGR